MLSPIVQYQPSREFDYAWCEMHETVREHWELDQLLPPDLHTPSGFLIYLRQWPAFVQFDDNKIVHAAWFIPFMGAVVLTVWCHPDYRRRRELAWFFMEMIQGAFDQGCNAVIGWIRERATPEETRAFIKLHERFGYEHSGLMPQCFEGEDCHVVVCTPEGFDMMSSAAKRSWHKQRNSEG